MAVKLTGGPFKAIEGYCRLRGYPVPVAEHRFAPPRRFAFDVCWPASLAALEIEGGVYGKGKPCPLCRRRGVSGHTSVERLKSDMEKYNLAAALGWAVYRCRPEQIDSGEAFGLIDGLFTGGAT